MPAAAAGGDMNEWRASPVGGDDDQQVTVPGRPAEFAGADAVRYTTTLADPRDPEDDVAVLTLRGVYAHAELELTSPRVGGDGAVTHDAYFEPLSVPFRPDGETRVALTCETPRDRFGGLHDTDTVPAEQRVPGVWWDATVEGRPLPYVDRLRVRPERTDDGARLHVRTTVVTGGPVEERITYSLKPEGDLSTRGMMDRATVETAGPGRTTVEHTVDVRDPALWWPAGLGEQHRYRLRAKLGDHEHSVTTGVCEVERDGGALRVNGERLPVRGLTLLTDDPADVRRARELNATVVRARAHALPPAVYRACDEAGLLVWQDLPLTGPGGFDVERGERVARGLAGAYARHPSLAVVGVHDEPTDTLTGLGSGPLDRLRLRWRAWRTDYDRAGADAVAAAVPDSLPVVPVVGEPGIDHDAGAYYPGWKYGEPGDIDALLDRYPTTLLAAFGAGALGAETETAAGFDDHQHALRVDGGVEDSQAYQAEVVRTVAERARCRGVGALVDGLRDTDTAGVGVLAADGTPKAAADRVRAAFEPVQAFLPDPAPGETEAVVVNDRPTDLTTTLTWRVESGEEPTEGTVEVSADAFDRWRGRLPLPREGDRVVLSMVVDRTEVTNDYTL
jgi:hypothetical protein